MEILIPVIIVALIGLVCGVGLALASKFMAVPVDERVEKIRECLPGANCGACGFSGCDGYAAAIAAGEAEADKCTPGGSSVATQLSEILGIEISSEEKVAFIACQCSADALQTKYAYQGIQSCAAANLISKGPLSCDYGCLGFGDCHKECPFGAIKMLNGRPAIDEDLCTGCGICKNTCPKGIIDIIPKNQKVRVACSNKDKGVLASKACKVSCIGCKLCEKACEVSAIKVIDNLAVIDYSLCTNCGKCRDVCKRGTIK